jgi:hypothetical protein
MVDGALMGGMGHYRGGMEHPLHFLDLADVSCSNHDAPRSERAPQALSHAGRGARVEVFAKN